MMMFEGLVRIDLSRYTECGIEASTGAAERVKLNVIVNAGAHWGVYYCELAERQSCLLAVDPTADACFSSVGVHSPNEIVSQVIFS